MGTMMAHHPNLFDAKQQPVTVRIVEVVVAIPAIIGGLCMFFGMAWYCLELDTSRSFVRVLVAFSMLCTAPFGQIVYYFLAYRPQTARVEVKII